MRFPSSSPYGHIVWQTSVWYTMRQSSWSDGHDRQHDVWNGCVRRTGHSQASYQLAFAHCAGHQICCPQLALPSAPTLCAVMSEVSTCISHHMTHTDRIVAFIYHVTILHMANGGGLIFVRPQLGPLCSTELTVQVYHVHWFGYTEPRARFIVLLSQLFWSQACIFSLNNLKEKDFYSAGLHQLFWQFFGLRPECLCPADLGAIWISSATWHGLLMLTFTHTVH